LDHSLRQARSKTGPSRATSGGSVAPLAFTAALSLHLIALGLLYFTRSQLELATAPVIELQLRRVAPAAAERPRPTLQRQLRTRARGKPAAVAPSARETSPTTTPAAPTLAQTPQGGAPSAGANAEGLRLALRSSLGCMDADFLRLTPSERDRCRERTQNLGAGRPTYGPEPANPNEARALERAARCNQLWQTYLTTIAGVYPGGHPGGACG
jgi:hypothetical protein